MGVFQAALALVLGLGIAALGWAVGVLSTGGALAAAAVGGLTFGMAGLPLSVLLVAFFASSSLLTRIGGDRKLELARKAEKGGRRDAGQVLANGGLVAVAALLMGLSGDPRWTAVGAAALAVSTADTWATELGVLATRSPRLITTWRPVEPGTSGGISLAGSAAALAGALFIGGLTWAMTLRPLWAATAALAGLVGAFLDSLLGATLQAHYRCPNCGQATEQNPHRECGVETVHLAGWRWLNNDAVNFLAALTGSLAAAVLVSL